MAIHALPFRLGHRPSLDGLRGLAVLSVVAAHLHMIPGGVVGVDMLLVLSGFLITVLLVEEWDKKGEISLGAFYRKRFLRVLPPLVAMLVLGSIVGVLIGYNTSAIAIKESLLTLGFISNWHTIHHTNMPTFGHTWTLSLEVQFYLIWPVALAFMLRAGVRRSYILTTVIGGIVLSAALRIGWFTALRAHHRELSMRLFMGLDTRADTLLFGCLAGLVVAWRLHPWSMRFQQSLTALGWVSVGLMTYMIARCHHEQYVYYYGLSFALAAACATLLVWWIVAPPRSLIWLLERRAIVSLGRVSYAFYLFHMPLVQFFQPLHKHWGSAITSSIVIALSMAFAVLSYYFIERPVLSLRHTKPINDAPSTMLLHKAA
jgi:peptidoglycan/LPS O-acetylase OafA/YrhL